MKRQSGELPLEDKLQYDGEMKETKTNIKKKKKKKTTPRGAINKQKQEKKKKKKTNQMKISFSFRYLHY